jgi:uncharacterized delta-60 repeat protein
MGFRFSHRTRRPSAARSPHFRPQVDVLEDRCLLSAGALDTTFGNGAGYVTTAGASNGNAVLIQPWDGKIVVAGDIQQTRHGQSAIMGLVRYNADGSLDSTFGSGGTVVAGIATGYGNTAAALYPSTDTSGNAKNIVEAQGGSVARFNANGSLDTSFGGGRHGGGSVTVPWAGSIVGVVIQADGKIVVGGDNGLGGLPGSAFELTRFNKDGTLDTNFGSGGTATLPLGPEFSESLVLQADGKLVIGGEVATAGQVEPRTPELARFTSVAEPGVPAGTLDNTFNSAGSVPGTVTFSFPDQTIGIRLAIYPSTGSDTADYGKIAVAAAIFGNPAGVKSNQIALARYNANGTPDTTFGQSGQVVTPFPNSGGGAAATTIQGDGKIVVPGVTWVTGLGNVLSLLRYNTNGSLDTTFGSGGLVQTSVGSPGGSQFAGAIQPDGRIVAAAGVTAGTLVARFLPGPEIGTFTAIPSTVMNGSSLALSASNLTDGDPFGSGYATVTQVTFYAVDSSGNQTPLGTVTLSNNGTWTLNYTVSLASGSYTLFAEATDSDGIVGDSAFLPLTVQ